MSTVQHMKWWGWGVEGVSFDHHDKPAFAPFVRHAIDLDVDATPAPPMDFDDLDVPASRLKARAVTRLRKAVGADHVVVEDLDRVVHTYGKSLRDLMRLRGNVLPRVPDAVAYPGTEDEVVAVVDLAVELDAVVIPFGGGSNISGSLEPRADESRPVISIDMGRMGALISIDETANLARIQAGALGPDIEKQLAVRGWTLGHFPDSFTHSSLGGWVATRSSGMQSDKYGDIAEITKGLRTVRPGGVVAVRPVPSASTGPSVKEMILGSEGRLGVITEVTVQVHRIPPERVIIGYLFPNWDAGLAAMHDIAVSDAAVSVARLSDARETAFSFATQKASSGIKSKVTSTLMSVLEKRGWDLDEVCLSFIGYEGTSEHVSRQKKLVGRILRRHGGIVVGKGPGAMYDQKKFDTPYIRDYLLDRGAAADVSETAAPWSQLRRLYDATVAAANKAYADLGVKGWIMCHLSHSDFTGACLYFTFAFAHDDADPVAQYDVVKKAIQQSFVDTDGTLSHHHAVGTEHSEWLRQDISPAGADLMENLFAAADPGNNFNPGKILPE